METKIRFLMIFQQKIELLKLRKPVFQFITNTFVMDVMSDLLLATFINVLLIKTLISALNVKLLNLILILSLRLRLLNKDLMLFSQW